MGTEPLRSPPAVESGGVLYKLCNYFFRNSAGSQMPQPIFMQNSLNDVDSRTLQQERVSILHRTCSNFVLIWFIVSYKQ